MPPSAPGSVDDSSSNQNDEGEFANSLNAVDDAVGGLGSALAGMSVGISGGGGAGDPVHSGTMTSAPIGSGIFDSSGGGQGNAGLNANAGLASPMRWNSPSFNAIGSSFPQSSSLLNGGQASASADSNEGAAQSSFPEQLPSLLSSANSGQLHQIQQHVSDGSGELRSIEHLGNEEKPPEQFLSQNAGEGILNLDQDASHGFVGNNTSPNFKGGVKQIQAYPETNLPPGNSLFSGEGSNSKPMSPPGMGFEQIKVQHRRFSSPDVVPSRMDHRRNSSPLGSITGTSSSSRSASPHQNVSGNDGYGRDKGHRSDRTSHVQPRRLSRPETSHEMSGTQSSFAQRRTDPLRSSQPSFGHTLEVNADHFLNRNNNNPPDDHTAQTSSSMFLGHSDEDQSGKGAKNMDSPSATSFSEFGSHIQTHDDKDGLKSASSAHSSNVPLQQSPQVHLQSQPQPPQMLYVAVPTQDGRGQVLQPVRMVQLPGQPPAFVLPTGQSQGLVTMNNVASGGDVQGQGNSSQPVFLPVLPTASPSSGHNEPMSPSNPQIPKKQGIRRNKSFGNSPQQRPGINTPTNHREHLGKLRDKTNGESSSKINGLAIGNQFSSSFPHSNMNGMSNFDDQQLRSPTYERGEFHRATHRASLPGNIRAAAAESPTPNDFIASLYATPQRPPLSDLLGHVRRLSRDQVGCRLLQQSLDEEGPMAATQILNEGLSFWGEAMVDPFGNYLFQKILEKITPDERVILLRSVSARLVNASLNLHGTRSVQKVVELCASDEVAACERAMGQQPTSTSAEILTRSLAPAAARLCIDSHGNHVIQRILLKLPYHRSQFVFDAVAASVGDVARHRHGCCVIQRCLDSPPSDARSHLVRRIVEKALELMQDAYGNYVVQYVLDVCGDEDVHAVCESAVGKVNLLAIQKFSSNVMEKCLERCTDRVREQYLKELSDPDRIRELMMDPFGNYVIQRALAVASHSQAVRLVEAMKPHLLSSQQGGSSSKNSGGMRNTAGGRRIMAKICRRFPNFNLGGRIYSEEQQMRVSQRENGHYIARHEHQHDGPPVSPSALHMSSPSSASKNYNRRNRHYESPRGEYSSNTNMDGGGGPSHHFSAGGGGNNYHHL